MAFPSDLHVVFEEMAEPHRGLALRTNQLVRQHGKTNLLDGKPPAPQTSYHVAQRKVTTTTAQSAFTVFEDSPNHQPMDENNVIHMLEKKCREEKIKTSKEKKVTTVQPTRRSRAPLQEKAINVRPDSDDELYSARSQATDTSVTNNLLHLDVDDTTTCSVASSMSCDATEDFQSTLDEDIKRESRLYGAPQFDEDIYEYMRTRETKIRPKPDFLKKQKDITKEMRVILVDWLFEVVGEYTMAQETFHLAISLVDRVLSVFRVEKDKLQLIGGTALMIASKFEEIYPPETKDFVYMTDDSYKLKDFRLMERAILLELRFDVSIPTAVWFANRLTSQLVMSQQVRCAIEYILDLTMLDPSYLEYKPSYVAAACICYGNVLCGEEPWNSHLEKNSNIRIEHLQKIFLKLHEDFTNAPKNAIYQNYAEAGKLEVSKMKPPTKIPFEQ